MATDPADKRSVKTVQTAFDILEFLKENDGETLAGLTDQFDLAKSSIHRHLTTLEQREYVVKEGGIYYPSFMFLDFGEYTRTRNNAYILMKEKVEVLAEETGERVQFIVEEHGYAVYVHRDFGDHAVQTDPGIGKRIPLHATAAGKAILAELPQQRVDEIIERRELTAVTEQTITDLDTLSTELDEIAERGYSINDQENLKGLRAIGVSIQNPNGSVVGALSVSGPTHRITDEWLHEDLPTLLLGTANEIELNIAYS